jgi:hypothetical protein
MATVVQACDVGVIRGTRTSAPCQPSSRPWVIAAASLGSGMAFLDSTVLNVALPAVQAELEASAREAQWVYGAFALVLAAFLLLGGSLGDRYGRRRIFVLARRSSLSPRSGAPRPWSRATRRCSGRAGRGRGAPRAGVAGDRRGIFRGEAQGEGHRSLGGAKRHGDGGRAGLGRLAGRGGLLANRFPDHPGDGRRGDTHRAGARARESRPGGHRLDLAGAVLATTGLGGLVYGSDRVFGFGFRPPGGACRSPLGTVALSAFVFVERRGKNPMVPPSLFRSRTSTEQTWLRSCSTWPLPARCILCLS